MNCTDFSINRSSHIFFIPATLDLIAFSTKTAVVLPTFDFRYFFENQQIIILELKRTDLSSDSIKSDLYKWLLIDQESGQITPLDFLSIKSGKHRQERFFRQGYLSFDSEYAVYIRESSSVQNLLTNIHPEQIPEWVVTSVKQQLLI